MRISNHICTLAIVTLFTNCANDSDTYINDDVHVDNSYINGVAISAEDFTYENVTRADYSISETEGLVFNWSEGDTVGIYPVGGDQVAFPISEGEGSKTAQFDGGSWALRANKSYSAYYPFSKSNYLVLETRIPTNYAGQVQDGNGSLSHIQPYDYMACAATTPDENGYVNLQMKHLGCLVRFQLTLPEAISCYQLKVVSNNAKFLRDGFIDLTEPQPIIKKDYRCNTDAACSIELKNTEVTEDNKTLIVYMMMAPVDMSSSSWTLYLNARGKTFVQTVNGKNMHKGKAYNYSTTMDVACEAEAVDLGLSVKWASCNIEATSIIDEGSYFAFGETEPKDDYSETNYKFYNPSTGKDIYPFSYLRPEDDVAHVKWGNGWRMPTDEEARELIDKCTIEDYTLLDVEGLKVTGVNGNHIFLPYSGFRGTIWMGSRAFTVLWTSSNSCQAFLCSSSYYNPSHRGIKNSSPLYSATAIRPVKP